MTRIISLAAVALALFSCKPERYETFSGSAQGTTYTIIAKKPQPGLREKIDAVFEEIDLTFSMFRPESLTGRINRNETDSVTPLFEECFELAKKVHAQSEGYYDPTVKPLVDAWGFGPGEQQEAPCVECIMEYVGLEKIRIEKIGHDLQSDGSVGGPELRIVKSDPRVQLDFSSIAKGLTVDRLAELLDVEQITDYMIEVGGEVRVRGVNREGRPWRIGIDKPVVGLTREIQAVATPGAGTGNAKTGADTTTRALATSGNYRNRFVDPAGRLRVHTIDPLTGLPAEGEILSASIAAESCALADAWATGVVASRTMAGARRLLQNAKRQNAKNIEHYIIYSTPDGSTAVLHSPGFPLAE